MRIDDSAVDRLLAYVDGERPIEEVWAHPALQVARRHARFLRRDLSQRDVEAALAEEETVFGGVRNLEASGDRGPPRTRPGERVGVANGDSRRSRGDHSDSRLHRPHHLPWDRLRVRHRLGGRCVSEPQRTPDDPRQALYTAIHESSHVVYDGFHEFSDDLGPELLESADGRRRYFEKLFHTEAYATFTPLATRRKDGGLGAHDHPVSADYRVIDDDERLAALVERYDSFRQQLANGEATAQDVFGHIFGEFRLPYRLGTVMLDRAATHAGLETVQSGFRMTPATFLAEFDSYLDPLREVS